MPWTKYYDPKASTIKSVFTYSSTVFELVLKKSEFWAYILWNLLATTICIYWVKDGDIQQFEWEAATVMQYVMTFFVTFYNDRCFERYHEMYPACQDFMDAVVCFVQEMNASLWHEELQSYRIACTKYLLAVVYEYYMIVCGGKLSNKSWQLLINKGLLTDEEAATLENYPGGQATLVICSWVLFIMRAAVAHDCLWSRPADGTNRHQQSVHIYNRHSRHIMTMLKAAHRIGYMMALPIPFAYYHLMNLILALNILLLATFPALFRSYWTVLPFFVALLIYMGLREVSTALADPFNKDPVDFPIPAFISQTFDRAVCLMLSFLRPDARNRVLQQVLYCEDFTEDQLKRPMKTAYFSSDKRGIPKGVGIQCKWNYGSVFEDESYLSDEHSRKTLLLKSLYEAKQQDGEVEEDAESSVTADSDSSREEKARKAEEARQHQDLLSLQLTDLNHELEKIKLLSKKWRNGELQQASTYEI